MSYLWPIHLSHVSPEPQSVDIHALIEDLLARGALTMPKPLWLTGQKLNDSISLREWVGKKTSPFLQCPMGERRENRQRGREKVGGWKRNTRGYYWSCACLLNPHRAVVLQLFPLWVFKQPILWSLIPNTWGWPHLFYSSFKIYLVLLSTAHLCRLLLVKVTISHHIWKEHWQKQYYIQLEYTNHLTERRF